MSARRLHGLPRPRARGQVRTHPGSRGRSVLPKPEGCGGDAPRPMSPARLGRLSAFADFDNTPRWAICVWSEVTSHAPRGAWRRPQPRGEVLGAVEAVHRRVLRRLADDRARRGRAPPALVRPARLGGGRAPRTAWWPRRWPRTARRARRGTRSCAGWQRRWAAASCAGSEPTCTRRGERQALAGAPRRAGGSGTARPPSGGSRPRSRSGSG